MPDTSNLVEPRWRLRDPLAGYGFAFFLSTVTLSIALGAGATEDTVGEFFGGQAGFWLGLVGTVVLASKISGSGRLRDDLRIWSSRRDAVVGIVAGLATQLAVIPILYLPLNLVVDDLDLSRESRELFDSSGPTLLIALAVVLIAPVVEEMFFRGLLMGAIAARWGPMVGLIGSSIIFGVTHFQVLQLPALIAAGLCFGWMRVRTGALGPAMWAHAAFNACTVAFMYF